jgi:hypothetical protein
MVVLGRGLAPRTRSLFVCLVLLYPPIWDHFYWAQAQLAILGLLILGAIALDSCKNWVAGLLFALAIMLRLFPAIMLAYLILRRRWAVLSFVAVGLVVGAFVCFFAFGRSQLVAYLGILRRLSNQDRIARSSTSLGPLVSGLCFAAGSELSKLMKLNLSGASLQFASSIMARGAQLLVVLGAGWITLASRAQKVREDLSFGLWIIVMIALTPTSWSHYLVLLLFPYSQVMKITAIPTTRMRGALWLAIASYGVVFATGILSGVYKILSGGPLLLGGRIEAI